MAAKRQQQRPASFIDHLKQVLESINDPEMLGHSSPLAAPYFLGSVMRGVDASPSGRGEALCNEVQRTVESLWGGPLPDDGEAMLTAAENDDGRDRYDCLILELNYFKQRYRPIPRNQAEIYHDILHISRPTHDRHLRAAVDRLGALLLQRLRPAVRPEQPILSPLLIGRDALRAEAMAELKRGRTISLSGVGKTSLGAALADEWPTPAVFWYTFRPTFNDRLESFLLALGQFLHGQGASTLWRQLVADGGQIKDAGLALGLTLDDLGNLPGQPLLGFDELDFLRPVNLDRPNADHVRLLEFLDSLRGDVPLLLISQRVYWESDQIFALAGLSQAELSEWLRLLNMPHSAQDVEAIYDYTLGNARLIELCIALYQTDGGSTIADVLDELPDAHALPPLWHRLERRLSSPERHLAYALSVFRSPAPEDVWRSGSEEESIALAQLLERHLVQSDDQGGVALLPALRELILADQAAENRERAHFKAAQIRAARGEHTAAAFHLQQADEPEMAVAYWYPHRQSEINRGEAGSARAIFSQISQRRLTNKRRKELRILRAELHELIGQPESVIEELQDEDWASDEEERIDAALLWGKALDIQGRSEAATEQQAAGIDTATRLMEKLTRIYMQRSLSLLHERDLANAWQEVDMASHNLELMKGTLYEKSGNYTTARHHHVLAREIAVKLDFPAGIAKSAHRLANVALRLFQFEEAIERYDEAMDIYRRMGDRVSVEVVRSGIATVYMDSRQYQHAIEPARQALSFFERMQDSFWTALNAANLAESYYELGDYDAADEYAQRVLTQEEPHLYPYALFTLGRVAQSQLPAETAALYFEQAAAIAEQNDDVHLLAYVLEEQAQFFLGQGRKEDACAAAQRALSLFRAQGVQAKISDVEALIILIDAYA